jgi:thiamine biosynthesis lipoprotein
MSRSAVSAALAGLLLSGCGGARWHSETRELYHGIPVTVRFTPEDPGVAATAWKVLEQVEEVFNDYRDDSFIGGLNTQAERTRASAHADMGAALERARELHEITGGAFDVTCGALRRLWKGAAEKGRYPSPEEIEEARSACGMGKVKLEREGEGEERRYYVSVSDPKLKFDFGGLAKGLALDWVSGFLKDSGVQSALIQAGGETCVFGSNPRGRPFTLGIQHPLLAGEVWTAVRDRGQGLCVSTSGNYQQPIRIAGRDYYHIWDPRTGLPADARVLSVTVLFPGAGRNGLADGLTTAGVVLGPEKFLPLVEKQGGEALVLVQQAGRIHERKTSGWDKYTAKD